MERERSRRLIASEWLSLDGVFDANSMDTWFSPFESEERNQYIRENVHSSDALLLGRITYEMLAQYWPNQRDNQFGISDRLNGMPKHVVSTTLKDGVWNNTSVIDSNVEERVAELKKQRGQDIIIFGSARLVESLMSHGLIDEYRLLVHPVIAVSGKRFFRDGMAGKLKLARTTTFKNGVMVLRYEPA